MGHMDLRLAEISRSIDPVELGRRIRVARVAAGMTQAQVAADEVTAAYLSRIEDGQRRPEAGLLERMAGRMGITLHELLTGITADRTRTVQLALDHAEISLASGDHATALQQASTVLTDSNADLPDDLKAIALRVQAGAFEAAGDLNGAIVILEELTSSPSADANWLRSLIALSRCYRDSGEFAKAIAVGETAAETISALGIEGLTEAIQLTVTVAAAYHRLGDLDEAMRACMRALQAAEKYDSPVAKASAYWNASVIENTARGATAMATDLARKALALFEAADDNRNLAKVRAEVATLQLSQDPPDGAAALETLKNAEQELTWSGASAWEIALLHITRGRAHMALGNHGAALEDIQTGLEMAPDQAPFLRASADSLKGRIAAAEGRLDDARSLYRNAVMELTGAGSDRDAAQLWFDLANLLSEVGDTEGALQAFRSAGASTGLRASVSTSIPTLGNPPA